MKRSIDADLEVILDDGSVMVHASILTVASAVFRTMLTSGMSEETSWTITLQGKTKDSFLLVYNMLHTETAIPLTTENVFDVITLAHEYDIKTLFTNAYLFLQEHFHLCCGKAYVVAKRLNMDNLLESILKRLDECSNVGDFFLDDAVFSLLPDHLSDAIGLKLTRGLKSLVNHIERYLRVPLKIPTCKYACKAILQQMINFLCVLRYSGEDEVRNGHNYSMYANTIVRIAKNAPEAAAVDNKE